MSLVVSFEEIFESKSGLLSGHHTWNRIELAAVAEILNGYAFKSDLFSKENGFPLIRIRDIAKNRTETYFMGTYPKEYIVRSGDLLIGMDGNFSCNEWRGKNGLLNQRVCKIIPDERYLNKRFLLFAINGYLAAIQQATSSVTVGHLSSQDVLRIPFPLPPFNEQRRIVAKLERLLEKVDTCKERLEKIPAILKRFRQSVLAAACSGRLTADWRSNNQWHFYTGEQEVPQADQDRLSIELAELPENWVYTTVGSVADSIKYGTAKRLNSKQVGVATLRIPNVVKGFVDLSELKYAEFSKHEYEGLSLQPGDILIVRSNGSVTLVGKCALVTETAAGFAYAGYLIRVRLLSQKIAPHFAYIALSSDMTRIQIELPARSTSGVHNINSEEIKKLVIPLPPLKEQHEIVRRVEALFKLADDIEKRHEKARAHVDKLTQSILAKAFRGELVPQDPDDEPASVLLKRIRAEREKRETEGRAGRQGSWRRTRAGKVHPERNNSSNR